MSNTTVSFQAQPQDTAEGTTFEAKGVEPKAPGAAPVSPAQWDREHTEGLRQKLLEMGAGGPTSSTPKAREAAALLVDQEIVETRLKGRAELLQRWKSSNKDGYRYLVGKKAHELSGTTTDVQRVDALLAKPKPLVHLPNGQVVAADGRVMSRAMAKKVGLLGEGE